MWPWQYTLENGCIQKGQNVITYIWATFVRKIVIKNFQKSPNLVTLTLLY